MKKTILIISLILTCLDINSLTLFCRDVVKDVKKITGELTEQETQTVKNIANILVLKSGKDLNELSRKEYTEIVRKTAIICRDGKVQFLLKLGDMSEKVIAEILQLAENILNDEQDKE